MAFTGGGHPMLMDLYPSKQHAVLQHAVRQLQQEVTRASSFYLKSDIFQITQKFARYLAYCCRTICHRDLLKIANLVTLRINMIHFSVKHMVQCTHLFLKWKPLLYHFYSTLIWSYSKSLSSWKRLRSWIETYWQSCPITQIGFANKIKAHLNFLNWIYDLEHPIRMLYFRRV